MTAINGGLPERNCFCVLCKEEFTSVPMLEAHIAADHYFCLPYECEKCKFAKFPTEFTIMQHSEGDHGLTEFFVRYRVSPEIKAKRREIRRCLERSLNAPSASSSTQQNSSHDQRSVSDSPNGEHQPGSRPPLAHVDAVVREPLQSDAAMFNGAEYKANGTGEAGTRHNIISLDMKNQVIRNSGDIKTEITFLMEEEPFSFSTELPAARSTQSPLGNGMFADRFLSQQHQHLANSTAVSITGSSSVATTDESSGKTTSAPRPIHRATSPSGSNPTLLAALSRIKQEQANRIGAGVPLAKIGRGPSSASQPHLTSPSLGSVSTVGRCRNPSTMPANRPHEIPCAKCQAMVNSRPTSLMYHVNVKHLKLPLFECRRCGERFLWNRSAAVRHVQRHGGNDEMIKNNTDIYFPTLNRVRKEYFNIIRSKSYKTHFSALDLQRRLGSLPPLNALGTMNGTESGHFGGLASAMGPSSSHQHSSTPKSLVSSVIKDEQTSVSSSLDREDLREFGTSAKKCSSDIRQAEALRQHENFIATNVMEDGGETNDFSLMEMDEEGESSRDEYYLDEMDRIGASAMVQVQDSSAVLAELAKLVSGGNGVLNSINNKRDSQQRQTTAGGDCPKNRDC